MCTDCFNGWSLGTTRPFTWASRGRQRNTSSFARSYILFLSNSRGENIILSSSVFKIISDKLRQYQYSTRNAFRSSSCWRKNRSGGWRSICTYGTGTKKRNTMTQPAHAKQGNHRRSIQFLKSPLRFVNSLCREGFGCETWSRPLLAHGLEGICLTLCYSCVRFFSFPFCSF